MNSLEVWLSLGKKVNIGGKELLVMPLPLSRLREAVERFETHIKDSLLDLITVSEGSKTPNVFNIVSSIISSFNTTDLVYELLMAPKHPETGEPINGKLDKQWLEDHLDIPTVRMIVVTFVEVNEVENVLKNLQSLPVVKELMEMVVKTYGAGFLKHLRPSMASTPDRSASLPSLRSTDISESDITGIQGSGLKKGETETLLQ